MADHCNIEGMPDVQSISMLRKLCTEFINNEQPLCITDYRGSWS